MFRKRSEGRPGRPITSACCSRYSATGCNRVTSLAADRGKTAYLLAYRRVSTIRDCVRKARFANRSAERRNLKEPQRAIKARGSWTGRVESSGFPDKTRKNHGGDIRACFRGRGRARAISLGQSIIDPAFEDNSRDRLITRPRFPRDFSDARPASSFSSPDIRRKWPICWHRTCRRDRSARDFTNNDGGGGKHDVDVDDAISREGSERYERESIGWNSTIRITKKTERSDDH